MSKQNQGPLGKLEWLKNISVAITGLFGSLLIMIGYECIALISNPDHTSVQLGLVINWHWFNAVLIFLLATGVLLMKIFWDPIAMGLRENEAKLFYINWMNRVKKVDELLQDEEEKLVIKSVEHTEIKPTLDHRIDSPSTVPYTAPDLGSVGTVPLSPEDRERRKKAIAEELESLRSDDPVC